MSPALLDLLNKQCSILMVQRGIFEGNRTALSFFGGSLSSRNIYSFWTKPVNLWSGLHGFILRVELSLNFENCAVNKNHGCFKNHTATCAYNLISPSAKIGWFQILKQLWQQPFMWWIIAPIGPAWVLSRSLRLHVDRRVHIGRRIHQQLILELRFTWIYQNLGAGYPTRWVTSMGSTTLNLQSLCTWNIDTSMF